MPEPDTFAKQTLDAFGLRQPRWPKPHVMKQDGWWYLVDTESDGFDTWIQPKPITYDPRPKP